METKKLLFAALIPLFLIQIVYGQPSPNNDFGDAKDVGPNPIKIILAVDEEVADGNYGFFGSTLTGQEYVRRQTIRAISRFPFKFQIALWKSWDSDDSYVLTETLLEMERELGWEPNTKINGKPAILVGWTGQSNCGDGGATHIGYHSCICKTQCDWASDNTAQEEISHIIGIPDHCLHDDCVMSQKWKTWYWILENRYPFGDSVWIAIFNWQIVGYISPHWCPYHKELLEDKYWEFLASYQLSVEGASIPIEGFGTIISDPCANPTNPPTTNPPEGRQGLNPVTWKTWLLRIAIVLMGVAMGTATIMGYWIYKRRKTKTTFHKEE